MKVSQILGDLVQSHTKDCELSKISQSHDTVEEGDLFIAIKGSRFDSHKVLGEVSLKNPSALIVEDVQSIPNDYKGAVFQVKSSRRALDILCHAYFGFPSKDLFCVGVTGTNGKTTTTHMVEYALNQLGFPTGVVGTIDHHLLKQKWVTHLTSPGSFELYSRLKDFINLGAKALSMEVSSHALDQDRMSSCHFDVGVFTNLSRDHLDYHHTMEEYFHAKEKLFTKILANSQKKNKFAILNSDDPYIQKINLPEGIQKITYGERDADLTFKILKTSFAGQELQIEYKDKVYSGRLRLCGQFNVLNFLATLGVLLARDIPIEKGISLFNDFYGVKGRLESVANNKGVHVFVDYAHTPAALENVLKTLHEIKGDRKIITVFGCGGDRDKGKRPLMGEVASRLSDMVIVTSDNPRTEDPKSIIDEILVGCRSEASTLNFVDRRRAIEEALKRAKNGDAVLIAGKGHENYQILGKTKIDFDDAVVVREILEG